MKTFTTTHEDGTYVSTNHMYDDTKEMVQSDFSQDEIIDHLSVSKINYGKQCLRQFLSSNGFLKNEQTMALYLDFEKLLDGKINEIVNYKK